MESVRTHNPNISVHNITIVCFCGLICFGNVFDSKPKRLTENLYPIQYCNISLSDAAVARGTKWINRAYVEFNIVPIENWNVSSIKLFNQSCEHPKSLDCKMNLFHFIKKNPSFWTSPFFSQIRHYNHVYRWFTSIKSNISYQYLLKPSKISKIP